MSEYTYLCAYSIQTRYYTGTVSAIYCIRLYKHRKKSSETVTTMRTKLGWVVTQCRRRGKPRGSSRVLCIRHTQFEQKHGTIHSVHIQKKVRQVGVHGGNWNAYEQTNKVVLPIIQNVWFIYRECLYINPCFHEFMPFFISIFFL